MKMHRKKKLSKHVQVVIVVKLLVMHLHGCTSNIHIMHSFLYFIVFVFLSKGDRKRVIKVRPMLCEKKVSLLSIMFTIMISKIKLRTILLVFVVMK